MVPSLLLFPISENIVSEYGSSIIHKKCSGLPACSLSRRTTDKGLREVRKTKAKNWMKDKELDKRVNWTKNQTKNLMRTKTKELDKYKEMINNSNT